jgi:hypothetical protein
VCWTTRRFADEVKFQPSPDLRLIAISDQSTNDAQAGVRLMIDGDAQADSFTRIIHRNNKTLLRLVVEIGEPNDAINRCDHRYRA